MKIKALDLSELLAGAAEDDAPAAEPTLPLEGLIARLRDDAVRLDEEFHFSKGDLVHWKEGMDLHNCGPGPYIFRRYLPAAEQPRETDHSRVYFCEPLDCVVGAVRAQPTPGGHGTQFRFVEWVVPARRLAPFAGQVSGVGQA